MAKIDRVLTESAIAGYDGKPEDGLFSSPCWLAHKAGQALAAKGVSRPVSARSSRGYSVRVETAGQTEFLIRFSGNALDRLSIERL